MSVYFRFGAVRVLARSACVVFSDKLAICDWQLLSGDLVSLCPDFTG